MPQLVMILQILALYVMQVLSLGLIWHNFLDATKEGDGNRIIQCWKFLLLAFKATNRKSYCIEALIELASPSELLAFFQGSCSSQVVSYCKYHQSPRP